MKLWLFMALALFSSVGYAQQQCRIVLMTDPPLPISNGPTAIRLQHFREGLGASPPTLVSIGKSGITVQQFHNNLLPPALPNLPCGISPAVPLGVLSPGRYQVNWIFRHSVSSQILQILQFELFVQTPAIPTLTAPWAFLFTIAVAIAGMLMLGTRL